jgi:hypothetical protein
MAEQDTPAIAQPLMEVDAPGGAVLLEIRRDLAQLQTHWLSPRC